ncbi:1,4-dihydroxy-2-naphthoate octaprenyltransferase [bacterium HR11]|nr:1,4-dihydroxy-2-naphthoate octaprenyltransferase [bacterium HR11]
MDPTLMETLRIAKKIFQTHKTLTLVTSADGRVWAGKVYYGEEDGYIYVALEQGRNYRNILANPRVFFVIEHGVPDRFIQGEGIAERLGPIEERPERHIIFRNALELVVFAKSFPGVEVFRIRPTRLYVSDFTGVWKPRAEVEVTDEVLRVFQTELKTRVPAWKVYWKATRPFAFTVTVMPVLLGALMAPRFSWAWFLLTFLGALLLHAGVNVISDAFDYRRGVDTWRVLGSSRVLVDGLMVPGAHLRWGLLLFGLGCLTGLVLTYFRGWPVLAFGLVGAVLGFFYTAPPLGLKYWGLGDLAVFLAFGPLMAMGTYYVQTQEISWRLAWLAVPIGLLTIAILHGNNFRDVGEDARAGYRTLAGLLGPRGSSLYYLGLVGGAYAATVVFVVLGWLPIWTLLVFGTVPYAWRNIRVAFQPARVAFTFLDLLTAQLHMLFGLALIGGLLLGRWVRP